MIQDNKQEIFPVVDAEGRTIGLSNLQWGHHFPICIVLCA